MAFAAAWLLVLVGRAAGVARGPFLFFRIVFVAAGALCFSTVSNGGAGAALEIGGAKEAVLVNAIQGGISLGTVLTLATSALSFCVVLSSSQMFVAPINGDCYKSFGKSAALLHCVIAAAPVATEFVVGRRRANGAEQVDCSPPSALFPATADGGASAGGDGASDVDMGGANEHRLAANLTCFLGGDGGLLTMETSGDSAASACTASSAGDTASAGERGGRSGVRKVDGGAGGSSSCDE